MNGLIEYGNYQEYEQALDTEITKATEGFVRIGYLLKVARDTDILRESGYRDVNELAQKRYGLDKTQVSRFIHINDRFSEGGYSDRLLEQYRGFGHTKLTVMLQLPEEITEELTPEFSRNELQEIREEVEAEVKISDLEVLMEEKDERQQDIETTVGLFLHQVLRDDPELYVRLHETVKQGGLGKVRDALAPQGTKLYSARIPGMGRKMMFLETEKSQFSILDVRTNQKEFFGWEELEAEISRMLDLQKEPEHSWSAIYSEEFPKKKEIVPEQQAKKESKVQKAKVKKDERTNAKGNHGNPDDRGTDAGIGKEAGGENGPGKEESIGNGGNERRDKPETPGDAGEPGVHEKEWNPNPDEEADKISRPDSERTGDTEETIKEDRSAESEEPEGETGAAEEIAPAQKEPEILETETCEVIPKTEDYTQEKPYGTRKDYLDKCTEYGIASYLKKNLDIEFFRNAAIEDLENWFLKEVDYKGREIEEYEIREEYGRNAVSEGTEEKEEENA